MSRTTTVLMTGWLLLVLGGLAALERYKAGPGPAARAPGRWPSDSGITRAADRPTLLVFAHPHCPCTHATLKELQRLAARVGSAMAVEVAFVRPDGTGPEWEDTALWALARAIPQAALRVDRGGAEARRFGSTTSGQVLLYAAGGELMFHGGITLARGHEGDSPGAERITQLVKGGRAELAEAPVFGCPLHDPEASR